MSAPLTCPSCGATAAPDASRCDFCTSALVKVACPNCLNALFEGMRFCPHCGTRATREAGETDETLTCPGCKTEMSLVHVGAIRIHECSSCVSSWMSAETFLDLCTSREERGALAAVIAATPKSPPVRKPTTIRYLPCPVCAKIMNRTNFGKRSGIIIDVCKGHGVWFEHQELQGVLAFIDQGGMERTRALDKEKETEERRALARQLRELARDREAGGSSIVTTRMIHVRTDAPGTGNVLDIVWKLFN
jgi:Zn-finger nucleic acid-binding protein